MSPYVNDPHWADPKPLAGYLLRVSSQRLTAAMHCDGWTAYLGRVYLAFFAAKPCRVRVCDEQRQPACVGASDLAVVPQQLTLVRVEQRVGVAVVPAADTVRAYSATD